MNAVGEASGQPVNQSAIANIRDALLSRPGKILTSLVALAVYGTGCAPAPGIGGDMGGSAKIRDINGVGRAVTMPYDSSQAEHKFALSRRTYDNSGIEKKYKSVSLVDLMADPSNKANLQSNDCKQIWSIDQKRKSNGDIGAKSDFRCLPPAMYGKTERQGWVQQGIGGTGTTGERNMGGTAANKLGWLVLSSYTHGSGVSKVATQPRHDRSALLTFIDPATNHMVNVELVMPASPGSSALRKYDIHAGGVSLVGAQKDGDVSEFGLKALIAGTTRIGVVNVERLYTNGEGRYFAPVEYQWGSTQTREPHISSLSYEPVENVVTTIGYRRGSNTQVNEYRLNANRSDLESNAGSKRAEPIRQTKIPLKRAQGAMIDRTNGVLLVMTSDQLYFMRHDGDENGPIHTMEMPSDVVESLYGAPGLKKYCSVTENPPHDWKGSNRISFAFCMPDGRIVKATGGRGGINN